MAWTTSADIRARLQRQWERGRILTARIDGSALFPMSLPLGRPQARALAERFDEVRRWIRELETNSKARLGYGYEIGWAELNHRSLGKNRIPDSLAIPTEDDFLRLVGKAKEAQRFQALADATLASFPALRAWIAKHPFALLEHADDWPRVLAVLAWFREHPRPRLFLRQLDIADVDTKFIETHRGLLAELLDETLPESVIDPAATAIGGFERRYGLLSKPDLIRFRILDDRFKIQGLSDLVVRCDELAGLNLAIKRVFIAENEINGLCFPAIGESIVLFGMGYSIDRLAEIRWMEDKDVFYWGDIDTHGFAILNRVRGVWPHTRSLLMDRGTLMEHQRLWVTEEKQAPGPLARLTAHERQLFEDLRAHTLGSNVRLEQERISFGRLTAALRAIEVR